MTTDPTTRAREVLDIQEAHEGMCKRTGLALPASMDDMETLANAAPELARAMLTVAELADRWESVVSTGDYEAAMQNAATDLRDALNGDNT